MRNIAFLIPLIAMLPYAALAFGTVTPSSITPDGSVTLSGTDAYPMRWVIFTTEQVGQSCAGDGYCSYGGLDDGVYNAAGLGETSGIFEGSTIYIFNYDDSNPGDAGCLWDGTLQGCIDDPTAQEYTVTIGAAAPTEEFDFNFMGSTSPMAVVTSVTHGVQQTGGAAYPLMALAGVPLAFVIGKYTIVFIRLLS